jgi:cell division protein FtsA
MSQEQIIVGLEVGTAKTCAVVGEVLEGGNIMIVGVGQAPSRGVRKGEIVDMDAAAQDIHQAVTDAEENTGVEIHNVCASVSGGHLRCLNNRGSVIVPHEDRVITDAEVRNVLLNAKVVNIPVENVVVHAIRQHFYVDGHNGVQNPVGMFGARLDADVHVVHGVRNRLQNTIKCIKQVPLDVANICVSSFASALAVLTTEDQQLGALVIDIGAGTTDYIVYREGIIRHSGVLAIGGDHLTNDLAIGLHVPVNRAEQLKLEHGAVIVPAEDTVLTLKRDVGLPDRQLSRHELCQIMQLRVAEMLTIIHSDLAHRGLLEPLGAGVFITGGSSRLPGLAGLAGEIFEMPVHLGHTHAVNGPASAIENPEYSTAIGLIRFALGNQRDQHQAPTPLRRVSETFHHVLQRLRALFM